MALSIEMARPFASSVTIFTDTKGDQVLKQYGFKDRTNLLLDKIPEWVTPAMFAYPKMFASASMSEPFVHLDHDAFVKEDFSVKKPDCGIVTEFLETMETAGIFHPHGVELYRESYARMVAEIGHEAMQSIVPGAPLTQHLEDGDIIGYNCGFIGANNLDVAKEWFNKALQGFELFAGKTFAPIDNIVVEQSSLYFWSRQMGWDTCALFDKDDLPGNNYYHVLGDKTRNFHRSAPLVFDKLRELNPLVASKIWKRFGISDRKNIRSAEVFLETYGKIDFTNSAIEADFMDHIGLFVANLFTHPSQEGAEFDPLRNEICQSLAEHNVCQESGEFNGAAFMDVLYFRKESFLEIIKKYAMDGSIGIDALNRAARKAIYGGLFVKASKSKNEPKGAFNFKKYSLKVKKIEKDLLDALDDIVAGSDEPLPEYAQHLTLLLNSRDRVTRYNASMLMDSKFLRLDLASGEIIRSKYAQQLIEQNTPAQEADGPSVTQMAKNLGSAAVGFAKSGFSMATPDQVAYRMDICSRCEFWKPDARFGLGKCLKCGCTSMKQKLASSVCPIGSWPALSKEEVQSNYIPSTNPYRSSS